MYISELNRLYNPRSIASREKGELPPIIIVSNFIGGISIDKNDPCIPSKFHLKSIYKKLSYFHIVPNLLFQNYHILYTFKINYNFIYFAILSEQDKLRVGFPRPGLVRNGPTT